MRKINDFTKVLNNKDNTYFIHYSCENLNDSNEGLSPRVTSIAILNFGKEQAESFSMHLSAECLGISKDDVKEHYDEIELDLLEKYNNFLRDNKNHSYWIHWNMSNVKYGFAMLEHRYNVLSKKQMVKIPDEQKFNLSSMLKQKYGKNYAKDPKLQNLMELNADTPQDFLTGAQENEAFIHGEFIKMHSSTMCKVYYFRSIFNKMMKNRLKTNRRTIAYMSNKIADNWFVRILAVICTFYSVFKIITDFLLKE